MNSNEWKCRRHVEVAKSHDFPGFFSVIFIYVAAPGLSCTMRDLVPWPGIKPRPLALRVLSLSHWTTREVQGPEFWNLAWEESFLCWRRESVPSLLPCELQRPPGRMEGQTGPFRIEPGEGREKYKSVWHWKALSMVMSFLAAKAKRETLQSQMIDKIQLYQPPLSPSEAVGM